MGIGLKMGRIQREMSDERGIEKIQNLEVGSTTCTSETFPGCGLLNRRCVGRFLPFEVPPWTELVGGKKDADYSYYYSIGQWTAFVVWMGDGEDDDVILHVDEEDQ
jgi:hypothetical protein